MCKENRRRPLDAPLYHGRISIRKINTKILPVANARTWRSGYLYDTGTAERKVIHADKTIPKLGHFAENRHFVSHKFTAHGSSDLRLFSTPHRNRRNESKESGNAKRGGSCPSDHRILRRTGKKGALSRDDAQRKAAQDIRALRYMGKEYFWINDLAPRMIMHPSKPELEGSDLGRPLIRTASVCSWNSPESAGRREPASSITCGPSRERRTPNRKYHM